MRITFTNLKADYEPWLAYAIQRPVLKKRLRKERIWASVGSSIMILFIVAIESRNFWAGTIVGAIILALMLGTYGSVQFNQIKKESLKTFGADRLIPEERALVISAEGISFESGDYRLMTKWPAIAEVAVSSGHILIFAENEGAFIVPRRAFSDEKQREGFLAALKEHANRAQLTMLDP